MYFLTFVLLFRVALHPAFRLSYFDHTEIIQVEGVKAVFEHVYDSYASDFVKPPDNSQPPPTSVPAGKSSTLQRLKTVLATPQSPAPDVSTKSELERYYSGEHPLDVEGDVLLWYKVSILSQALFSASMHGN